MKFSAERIQQLKKKLRKTFMHAKDWSIQNKKIAIPAAAGVFVIFVAVIVFIALKGGESKDAAQAGKTMDTGKTGSVANPIPVPETPLEENSRPEINALITEYFNALAEGDIEKVKSVKSYIDPAEEIRIQKKSELIERYENIACYTKQGPMENSYLVYAYVEAKFFNINTTAPGLYSYFVSPKEDGTYWILDGEMDDNFTDYFKLVSAQEDVADLFNRVKVKYAEAIDADADLKAFVEELPEMIDSSVGEALAKLEEPQTVVEPTEATSEEQTETAPVQEEAPAQLAYVKPKEVVNVRSSDSETADKVGKAQTGIALQLFEEKVNGWSKVLFEGKEAYIKSEFLEKAEAPANTETPTSTADTASTPNTPTNTTSNKSPGDNVVAKTTVNVRESANENGKRLGTIYKGEKLELIMPQADGWSKVKYKGQTGYVKSEFVE